MISRPTFLCAGWLCCGQYLQPNSPQSVGIFVTLIRVDAHYVYIFNRETICIEAARGFIFLGFLVALVLLWIQHFCDFFCWKLPSHCSCSFSSLPGRLTGIGTAIPDAYLQGCVHVAAKDLNRWRTLVTEGIVEPDEDHSRLICY